MGSLAPRPGPGQVWGFRVALLTVLFLNLVVLGLLITRPGALAPGAGAPTPTAAPAAGGPGATQTPGAGSPVAAGTESVPGAGTPVAGGAGTPAPAVETPPVHVFDPGGKIRGVNIPVWGPDFIVARPDIRAAPALGANWVALVSHWYVRSAAPITDGQIFREQGVLGSGDQRTASDASIGQAIDNAHALGLKVLLKPHVDWTAGGSSWRGFFYFDDKVDPNGRRLWWSSYRDMISATVRLAIDHNAEGICIGTEFWSINKEPASAAQWIAIIDAIRAAGYRGQLTYAANWGLGADAEYNRPGLQGVWEQLDFIGVDAYYPLSDARDPDLATLVAGWHTPLNQWDKGPYAELEALHARTGKPIVFTEVGYPATDFGTKDPTRSDGGPDNPALQSRAAQALYQVWEDVPWWDGALWWQYGPNYTTHSLQGRPILDTLRQIWTTRAGP